jgi:hypothetical protein
VDGRKETDEMRVEVVDISDDLTTVPAVVRKSTVNSDESAPASSSGSKEYRKQRRVGTGLEQWFERVP